MQRLEPPHSLNKIVFPLTHVSNLIIASIWGGGVDRKDYSGGGQDVDGQRCITNIAAVLGCYGRHISLLDKQMPYYSASSLLNAALCCLPQACCSAPGARGRHQRGAFGTM